MMAAHKSESPAATGLNAKQSTDGAILSPTEKEFSTTQAAFAIEGHSLQTSFRADDLTPTYWVSRWGQARAFTTWHSVCSFLTQIGGAK